MKKWFFAVLALVACTNFALAGVAPGCIEGCMGTAPNVGNITLPAGYQCNTNWPLPANSISCVDAVGNTWSGNHPYHEPPTYSRPKSQ